MPWVRIDDGFWSHPKVMAAGLEATGLFVRALSWSCQQLTDGKIPKNMMPALGGGARTKKLEAKLSEVALWVDEGGHYHVPDFLEYNKSREEVLKKRKEAAGRMARVRANKASRAQGVRANEERTSGEVPGKFAVGSLNPDPTRPDPSPKDNTTTGGGHALTWEAFRLAAPRSIGFPPTVFWESELKTLIGEFDDAYVAGHLAQYFAAGGKAPDGLARRCRENWGADRPATAEPTEAPCSGVRNADGIGPAGYPLLETCLLTAGHAAKKCEWSAPHEQDAPALPREARR